MWERRVGKLGRFIHPSLLLLHLHTVSNSLVTISSYTKSCRQKCKRYIFFYILCLPWKAMLQQSKQYPWYVDLPVRSNKLENEECNICATSVTKRNCKIFYCFQTDFLNMLLVCQWMQTDSPTPNSNHWLRQCCYVNKFNAGKMTSFLNEVIDV